MSGQVTNPGDTRVTYTSVNKNLPQVLNDLVQISGVNIIFSENKLNKTRKIKIQARNEKLSSFLNIILEPYRLDYEIIGENIVIVSKRSDNYGKTLTLSGFIRDKESGEALPFATLSDSIEQLSFEANENGFYSISVSRKEYKFKVSYLGYEPEYYSHFFSEDVSENIYLQSNNTLNEVIVTDASLDANTLDVGKKRYDKQNISQATFLGGEADINRLVGMSSGVSTGADGFGGLSVRGGSYDQNLILLDGVPLHHTGHALGLVSIFNSNIIQEATLYKSDFPAKYGGKLSSILDVRTREGNYKKISGEVGLSTLASKITLEGPILKDKASFLFSYRRTFADVWIKALSNYQNDINGDEGEASYKFYDLNAKINFSLGANHKFFLSYYSGMDDFKNFIDSDKVIEQSIFKDRQRNSMEWGNDMLALHLNSKLSNKIFSRLILYKSNWNFEAFNFDGFYLDRDTITTDIYNASLESSKIENYGGRFEVDFISSRKNILKLGAIGNRQVFSPSANYKSNVKDGGIYPNVLSVDDLESSSITQLVSNEATFFIENNYKFSEFTSIMLGLHNSWFITDQNSYLSTQPRFAFTTGSKVSSFKFAISNMVQYNQVLTDNQLGFPSDLWVTTTDLLKPASSWMVSAGNVNRINNSFNIGGEVYYKWMSDIISLNEGGLIPFDDLLNQWENAIPRGEGESYGIELDVFKRYGKTNFNINYTYSKSTRKFNDLNNGIVFDYKFDRTHMFNFNMKRTLGTKADVSLNFIYGTGNPTTLPTSEIIELPNSEGEKFLSIVYDSKNNVRIKDYMRVDVGFNFYTEYKFGNQKFFIGVYNLTNNTNPLYFDIKRNKFEPNVYELHSISVLPVLPAINYSLTF